MIDLTPLFQAVAALAAAAVTAFVIPYIKSKAGADRWEQIAKWVHIAVSAAEQLYRGSGRGEEKKAYVLAVLEDQGYCLDLAVLEPQIEAAVYALGEGGDAA